MSGLTRTFQLVAALPYAREHDLVGAEAAVQRDIDLAHRVRVGAAAERAHEPNQGERGVCLEGVVNRMWCRAECGVELPVGRAHGLGAVHVSGGSDRGRDRVDDRRFGHRGTARVRVA
jgi:hypothetical protein